MALTSHTDSKTIDKCLKIGMKEVFHKPLNAKDLKKILYMYHFGMSETTYQSYIEAENLQKIQA